jgi:hypothetical protein
MNTDITYCIQEYQIELCKHCLRNIRLYEKEWNSSSIRISMTTFTPNLTPTQNCEGYRHYYKEHR